MSRKGNNWGDAPMESLFGSQMNELVHRTAFPTKEAARHAIFECLEIFYKPLVPLAPADQHLVRGGLESDGEAQETLEGGGRRAASIEAEHELVEVGLEVLGP